MSRRSKRWQLEPFKAPCIGCGSPAQHRVNAGTGERHTYPHQSPTGEPCVEHEHQEAEERTRRICEAAGVGGAA